MTKQNCICFIFGTINLLYVLFIISQLDIFVGKFNFKVIYLPGLLYGFLVFPFASLILWKVRVQLEWLDYMLIAIPLLLWLLVIPGGSFTNFFFINFPLVWTVSLIYLFRFSEIMENKNIYVLSLALWVLITLILFSINYFIPALPE